jgi:lipoprotein-releasing system ATP-binding protein
LLDNLSLELLELFEKMLNAENITKNYGKVQVLNRININVAKGEIVSIVGASGAGKSTLINILSSLDIPDEGSVWIDGVDVFKLKSSKLSRFRNENIGIVFQFHNLLPEFSAMENVAMPAYIKGLSKKYADREALELMSLLGILKCKDHTPGQLSGGQAQRVAVARALINKPKIVFADEPSGSLDERNADDLHKLIFYLRQTLGQTFLISTHNTNLANSADRKITIETNLI